jgi:hypothetical protein
MRLVHESADGGSRVLATDVEIADSFVQHVFGLRFRSSIPDEYALVFSFDSARRRRLDMLFVRTPIDVIWLDDEEVVAVKTLPAWTGTAAVRADTFVELAPGRADGVDEGDRIVIEE